MWSTGAYYLFNNAMCSLCQASCRAADWWDNSQKTHFVWLKLIKDFTVCCSLQHQRHIKYGYFESFLIRKQALFIVKGVVRFPFRCCVRFIDTFGLLDSLHNQLVRTWQPFGCLLSLVSRDLSLDQISRPACLATPTGFHQIVSNFRSHQWFIIECRDWSKETFRSLTH